MSPFEEAGSPASTGLTIRPLGVGTATGVPLASLVYGRGWGEFVDAAMLMFLIEGGPAPILVDTGTPGPELTARHHRVQLERAADAEPRAVLAAAGYDPADIPIVVNTHLHWDHCANNGLFSRATFVVQERELAYASDPLPLHRRSYDRGPGSTPPWMAVHARIETVSGDCRIAEGVTVISLPGHTPGSQGVLVETAAGPYLIAGDTVDLYANWHGTSTGDHLPSSVFFSMLDVHESFEKIDALDCTVIPSHDPLVLRTEVFGHREPEADPATASPGTGGER